MPAANLFNANFADLPRYLKKNARPTRVPTLIGFHEGTNY